AHLEYLRRRLPDNPEVLVQLAQALDLQGRTDEARALLVECVRNFPDDAHALAERGRIANHDGDRALAEECLAKSIRLDPGDGRPRYQYYLALIQNGKQEEAFKQQEALQGIENDANRIKELLRGPLQVTPNDPAIPHEVAMIALRAGRPKEALRWLQT